MQAQVSGGEVPIDYVDFKLMFDWGISPKEFYEIPYLEILKYRQYKKAEIEGQNLKAEMESKKK